MNLDLLAYWPVLAGGLLLPGFLLGRITKAPAPLLAGFMGSAVVLFYTVLALDSIGVPLGPASVSGCLALVNLVLISLFWGQRRKSHSCPASKSKSWLPHGQEWLWLVPPFLGFAAIAFRATIEPLSGFDNVFRWDFLARQILKTGTLSFYPPMTSADFTHYGWCDGIPPLIPIFNLWCYISAGKATLIATTPRVLLEAGLLFYAVWRLARGLWGPQAGWPALAALSTSALLLWGVAMGQETGLTALTLITMLVFLDEYRRGGGWPCLLWAGIAAGVGGLSREYALTWPFIGLLALTCWGGLRSGWKIFTTTAALIAAPWYLRNWIHTGNPLFAQGVGGLFPVNQVHAEMMAIVRSICDITRQPDMIPYAFKLIAVLAGMPLVLGAVSACRPNRLKAPLIAGLLVVVALWIWSISQTAGGLVYSIRVLTPALALAAVLAADTLARLNAARFGVAALLVLLAGDAAIRSLCLPGSPLGVPWRQSFHSQLAGDHMIIEGRRHPMWQNIAAAAQHRGIVIDHPVLQTIFTDLGAMPVPLYSPQVACMFDNNLSFREVISRLKTTHIRFLIFSNHNPYINQMSDNHHFLKQLLAAKPVFVSKAVFIYDLDLIQPQ